MSVKSTGQVYTPQNIVNLILDKTNYHSKEILNKHIIDNSCGDGAFLVEIVDRYCAEFIKEHGEDKKKLKSQLQTYIHGIEIDKIEYQKALKNVDKIAQKYGMQNIKWDIINANTLKIDKCKHKMDFVVGNPPYVRVHNLGEDFERIKTKKFSSKGMTDLFIVFYELGLDMLKNDGKLSYITPSSIFNSLAGSELRQFFIKERLLKEIINLEHFQAFDNITTYTAILLLDKTNHETRLKYHKYNGKHVRLIDILDYEDFVINDKFYFSKKKYLDKFKNINKEQKHEKIKVKNGFATLADKVFISDDFKFESKFIIDALKASTGKQSQIIYPYDKLGNIIEFEKFEKELQDYLQKNKKLLERRSLDKKTKWYAFGRSQAIKDTCKEKISMNNLIKNIDDIKIQTADGMGVYSGLYILGVSKDELEKILKTDDFMEYLKIIGKYKSGGYYTFSSGDLQRYIVYSLEA